MSVQQIIIQYKTSASAASWTDLKTPSSYTIEFNDLDNDSYRSAVNGNLIRNVIKRRWIKLGLSYNYLTNAECNTICSAVNGSYLKIRCKSPAFGNITVSSDTNWVEFEAYVSTMSAETVRSSNEYGFSLSFNIIQSKAGTWQ